MNHIRHAFAADRADGEVNIAQTKTMSGHFLQREALRRELCESQFAGSKAVPARALDGDEFHGDLADREIGELRHLALDYHRAALALERFDSKQYRNGTRTGGTIECHVNALTAGNFHDARQRILVVDVNDVIGA